MLAKHRRLSRALAAFLIAPLVPPILMFLLSNSRDGAWVAKFALLFSLGMTLIVGMPLHVLFRRLGWATVWGYVLIGACGGLVASVLIFASTIMNALATDEPGPWTSFAFVSVMVGMLGCLSGVVFWLVARPDRS